MISKSGPAASAIAVPVKAKRAHSKLNYGHLQTGQDMAAERVVPDRGAALVGWPEAGSQACGQALAPVSAV